MAKLRAGGMMTRIAVEQTTSVDDGAGGYTSSDPVVVARMWARKEFREGGDLDQAGQIVSRRRYDYIARRRKDVTITADMRVREGDQVRTIIAVVEDDTDRSAMVLSCEEATA